MSSRLICLFLLLFSSPSAWSEATTYYTDFSPEYFHPDPNQACKPAVDSLPLQAGVVVVGYVGAVHSGCSYRFTYNGGPEQLNGTQFRLFSKTCEVGGSETLTWPIGREEVAIGDSSLVRFHFQPPLKQCFEGCYGNINSTPTNDFFGQPDSDPKYELIFANITYDMSAEACSTADAEPIPDVPPPPTDNPDPCEANPAAEGCSGGGDPGGGDPGGGDPGGGDPGGGDPGGGDPGGGDPGGGDPGGGDPGGGDPGGGDDGGAAGGYANCDVPLACEGDAIACAQLYLQKQQYCDGLQQSDFPGQQDDIADFLDQPAMQAEEDEEINLGDMFSEGSRFLPSSCPQAKTFSLTTGGGRTFSLSFEPLCQFASDLSYLIVAAAAVFYALYVGRAVGGE